MTYETDEERQARQSAEHRAKYEAIAVWLGVRELVALVPFTAAQVKQALGAGDEHLNTLPLTKWDAHHGAERAKPTTCSCCGQPVLQPRAALSVGVLGLWRAARLRHAGTDVPPLVNQGWSLSDTVCVLKHVARYHMAEEA